VPARRGHRQPDHQHRLAALDAEPLEVEAEFRQARGVVLFRAELSRRAGRGSPFVAVLE